MKEGLTSPSLGIQSMGRRIHDSIWNYRMRSSCFCSFCFALFCRYSHKSVIEKNKHWSADRGPGHPPMLLAAIAAVCLIIHVLSADGGNESCHLCDTLSHGMSGDKGWSSGAHAHQVSVQLTMDVSSPYLHILKRQPHNTEFGWENKKNICFIKLEKLWIWSSKFSHT